MEKYHDCSAVRPVGAHSGNEYKRIKRCIQKIIEGGNVKDGNGNGNNDSITSTIRGGDVG